MEDTYRDAKTYERANNVRVKYFLAGVKFEPNCTLFCRKSELCRDFTLFGVFFLAHFRTLCYFLDFFFSLFRSFGPFTLFFCVFDLL